MIRFINPGVQPPLYLDTANQRVGIGIASPTCPLDIQSGGTNVNVMRFLASDGSDLASLFESSTGACRLFLRNASGTTVIQFGTDAVSYFNTTAGLVVGTSSINSTALLEVSSTTKGFLPPRMTTTEKNAISSPATGLVVYDTTLNKLCVYTGAAWQTVTSA